VKLTEFIEQRKSSWDELDALIAKAGRRTERLEPAEILSLASLYRSVSADLGYVRSRFPTDPVRDRLERLVVDARARVNQGGGARQGVGAFFKSGYWALIWQRRAPMALAALALVVPALFGALWALGDDTLVEQLPPEFLWVTQAQSTDQGMNTVELVGFSAFVLNNNIRVTLLAFVLGVTWGLGTGYVVANNGLILGALAGLAVANDNWRVFLAAVMAHGVLELSCIVVGGGAGLSLGRAILRPGPLTRRESMAQEARASVQIALGTSAWLVLAGFIEGFGSRTGIGWIPTTIFGLVVGATFWVLVVVRGRGQAALTGGDPVGVP
jgi:uncharacterized membrane protein SpoIIM required for sporulation